MRDQKLDVTSQSLAGSGDNDEIGSTIYGLSDDRFFSDTGTFCGRHSKTERKYSEGGSQEGVTKRRRNLSSLQRGNAVRDVAVFNVRGIHLAEAIERR